MVLGPGESKQVTLTVAPEDLSFWSPALHKRVLEPGTFDVWVGIDSNADAHSTFQVSGGMTTEQSF